MNKLFFCWTFLIFLSTSCNQERNKNDLETNTNDLNILKILEFKQKNLLELKKDPICYKNYPKKNYLLLNYALDKTPILDFKNNIPYFIDNLIDELGENYDYDKLNFTKELLKNDVKEELVKIEILDFFESWIRSQNVLYYNQVSPELVVNEFSNNQIFVTPVLILHDSTTTYTGSLDGNLTYDKNRCAWRLKENSIDNLKIEIYNPKTFNKEWRKIDQLKYCSTR